MQKFVDRAGRIWIVDIDNTTLRRVKTLTGVQLLEAIDGDLVTRLSTDPLLLGDVLDISFAITFGLYALNPVLFQSAKGNNTAK